MNRLRALLACCCMLAPLPGFAQSNSGAAFTTAARGALLDGISTALGDYIFPQVAQRVRARLAADRPRLTAISDPQQFADAVSDDLHQAGNDRHLNLVYSADEMAPGSGSHAGRDHAR